MTKGQRLVWESIDTHGTEYWDVVNFTPAYAKVPQSFRYHLAQRALDRLISTNRVLLVDGICCRVLTEAEAA